MFRTGIDLSPDGRWFAFGNGLEGIKVVDPARREERILPRAGECTDLIFTADSTRMITSGMSGIRVTEG